MRLVFGKKLRTTEARFDFTGTHKKKCTYKSHMHATITLNLVKMQGSPNRMTQMTQLSQWSVVKKNVQNMFKSDKSQI